MKAGVVKENNGTGDELSCMLELQKIVSDTNELEVILKVYVDSYICASCDEYFTTTTIGEKLNNQCGKCKKNMQHTGPLILLTSHDQIRAAEQMTNPDGAFHFSSLYRVFI